MFLDHNNTTLHSIFWFQLIFVIRSTNKIDIQSQYDISFGSFGKVI